MLFLERENLDTAGFLKTGKLQVHQCKQNLPISCKCITRDTALDNFTDYLWLLFDRYGSKRDTPPNRRAQKITFSEIDLLHYMADKTGRMLKGEMSWVQRQGG